MKRFIYIRKYNNISDEQLKKIDKLMNSNDIELNQLGSELIEAILVKGCTSWYQAMACLRVYKKRIHGKR